MPATRLDNASGLAVLAHAVAIGLLPTGHRCALVAVFITAAIAAVLCVAVLVADGRKDGRQ